MSHASIGGSGEYHNRREEIFHASWTYNMQLKNYRNGLIYPLLIFSQYQLQLRKSEYTIFNFYFMFMFLVILSMYIVGVV